MTSRKNVAGTLLPMTVIEGVTVNILPNDQHEFLMTTIEVANGYGISPYTIRRHQMVHSSELFEGKHFVKGVSILNTLLNAQPHQVFWTKRGIVRLGFFIRSERAKLFRDWAEDLIIKFDEQRNLFNAVVQQKQLPAKRNHNRLTQERLLSIMADVCRIDDKELRLSISNKLMIGDL
jgi:hypothetical protein